MGPNACRPIGSFTRGETKLTFESDMGGVKAGDLSRWGSTSGAGGPWSDAVTPAVTA